MAVAWQEWEIDAAQENLIGRLQAQGDRETLRDRAQREFKAWAQPRP